MRIKCITLNGLFHKPHIVSFDLLTQKSRTQSTKSMGGRHLSTSGMVEQQMNFQSGPARNGLKLSRSDPALAPQFSSAPASSGVISSFYHAVSQHHINFVIAKKLCCFLEKQRPDSADHPENKQKQHTFNHQWHSDDQQPNAHGPPTLYPEYDRWQDGYHENIKDRISVSLPLFSTSFIY